jgi:hypothetical protein
MIRIGSPELLQRLTSAARKAGVQEQIAAARARQAGRKRFFKKISGRVPGYRARYMYASSRPKVPGLDSPNTGPCQGIEGRGHQSAACVGFIQFK